MQTFTYVIKDELGIHARPAGLLVKEAKNFSSTITLEANGKKGVAKGEYAIENLAFKELRNKGYLDQLKEYRNELTSKRLSLEERLDRQWRAEVYNQLTRAAGTPPVIQDNRMFFIYNLKASDVNRVLSAVRNLPFVAEAHANENGKYDFSNTLALAMNHMPNKYYDIRGMINL